VLVLKNRYDQYSYDPPTPKNTIVDWLNGQMSSDVDGDGDPIGHDHDPVSPGRGGQIKASYIKNEPNNGLSSNNVQGAINELKGLVDLGRIHVPVRQTVLQGKFDYNTRQPVFISEVPGQLKLNLWASEVPLVCTICDGYDIYGQKDYVFAFTQDVPEAWTLPANKSFLQLYIEYNPTTKTATFGYTEVLSVWDYPSAPTIDMHWIDKDNLWIVQQWNGTAWENKQRVFVGECTTDASSVTSVTCYAIQGKYDSGWFAVSIDQEIAKSCNVDGEYLIWGYMRDSEEHKEILIDHFSYNVPSSLGAMLTKLNKTIYLRTGKQGLAQFLDGSTPYPYGFTTGQARIFAKRVF
jgi:hypothetical protein